MSDRVIDFYTKNELPLRLALFWMSSQVCTVAGSFIAFGVLRMRGVLGKEGWRLVPFIRRAAMICITDSILAIPTMNMPDGCSWWRALLLSSLVLPPSSRCLPDRPKPRHGTDRKDGLLSTRKLLLSPVFCGTIRPRVICITARLLRSSYSGRLFSTTISGLCILCGSL